MTLKGWCSASGWRSSRGRLRRAHPPLGDRPPRRLPLLVASQTIPIVILAPILVVVFGFEIQTKLAIVALICFFPITVNTLDGLRSVDPELLKLMRTMGASRLQTLKRVEGPWALPTPSAAPRSRSRSP